MIISIEIRKVFFVIPNTMKTSSSRPILLQVNELCKSSNVTVVNTFIIQLNSLTEVINLFL